MLTEALSCGCPAVASNVGSVMDIMTSEDDLGTVIENQENIPDKDAGDNWAEAISETVVLSDREKRAATMGKYTWQWCARKALASIKSIGER